MTPFRTYRNASLSLWQSSVAVVVKKRNRPKGFARLAAPQTWRLDPTDPMMAATIKYCDTMNKGQTLSEPRAPIAQTIAEDPNVQAHLSGLHHQLALAMVKGNKQRQFELELEIKKYSIFDPGWMESVTQFYAYYKHWPWDPEPKPVYRSWKTAGKGDANYSLIRWHLPAKGKVAIVADWATGQPEANAVLRAACSFAPDAILNLGDTYYAGTEDEYVDSVLCPLMEHAINPKTASPIPVFCLAGNHDYYSGGGSFHKMLDTLVDNSQNTAQQAQAASYFCLRSSDGGWQFLAMDTGYNDHDATSFIRDEFEDSKTMTDLPPDELDWHADKLKGFAGRTILLSHHQLYSNNSSIGSPIDGQSFNMNLFRAFSSHFQKIAAWFWGHEHNLVVFDQVVINGFPLQAQLKRGRCVGHSAIPVDKVLEHPYASNFPNIPVLPGYTLADDGAWYNHGFEILQLNGVDKPLSVTYYQVPPDSDTPIQIGATENIS